MKLTEPLAILLTFGAGIAFVVGYMLGFDDGLSLGKEVTGMRQRFMPPEKTFFYCQECDGAGCEFIKTEYVIPETYVKTDGNICVNSKSITR